MVKPIQSGGESIFPDEVEAVLRYHPDVANAAVVGLPDRLMGQVLVAVVEAEPGQSVPSVEQFTQFCTGRLSGYKVPRAVWAVDHVVVNDKGKPDYDWAREVASVRMGEQSATGVS